MQLITQAKATANATEASKHFLNITFDKSGRGVKALFYLFQSGVTISTHSETMRGILKCGFKYSFKY
jgi:hypothetical protein